jgi:hypothetical protein
MTHSIYSVVLGTLVTYAALGADGQVTNAAATAGNMHEIQGEATDDLQPIVLVSKQQFNWDFGVDFAGPTNVQIGTWLKITNRVGSKLELWQNDGQKLDAKDNDALAAMRLPVKTTVSEATAGINRRWRGGQWLRLPKRLQRNGKKMLVNTGVFNLTKVYGISFTNEVVLKLTPLLYKADTNDMVRLVEFPPITLKLLTNGDVQKVTSQ